MMGMSLAAFTLLHVIISLIGIVAGLIAVSGWLKSDPSRTSDGGLSGDHDPDQRYGLPVPVHQTAAVACRRHHFAGVAGDRDVCALRQPACGRLASDLHGHGDLVAVSECVRAGGPVVPEDLAIEGVGADADRACVPDRAGGDAARLPRSDDLVDRQISTGPACRTLKDSLPPVKYTSELYSLTVISAATALMWVPYVDGQNDDVRRDAGDRRPGTRLSRRCAMGRPSAGAPISMRSRIWRSLHRW